MLRVVWVVMTFSLALAGQAVAADVKGSADHPLIKRYAGAEIKAYTHKAYDEYAAVIGPVKRQNGRTYSDEMIDLEGKITRILYRAPQKRSTLEIYRNYADALMEAGFEILFECKKDACGKEFYRLYGGIWDGFGWVRDVFITSGKDQRYLAAKRSDPKGDTYAFAYFMENTFMNSTAGPWVNLDVVDMAPIESNMVDASAMKKGLETEGRIALYGIYFDTDKDTMKPESEAAMAEIVKLLQGSPELKVHIVGHTDGVGAIAYNMDLSQRRARAIATALVNHHGIAEDRLTAAGVGPLAPVANNATEEGRAKNRRVELVEQYRGN